MRVLLPLVVLFAFAALPLAGASTPVHAPTSICHGERVGFEGYEEWCVNPTDPHCLIEENVWTGADGFSYCTGV
ncbi:MAG: hypothetical protein QOE90_133 [Thermoplasmata archaeon]|jgi:hypothetical protein|nr:hypothetical protein [Thermoplasmata archaeon]